VGTAAGILAGTGLFSGRHAELETFRRLLAGTAGGAGSAVVVTGEFGVGKTAMVTAAAKEAAAAGFSTVVAKGARLETGLNGGVIRQLSRQLSPARTPRFPEHDPFAALEAFHGLIRAAAAKSPLFLAVDDIHLADTWSKRCLAYARPRIAHLPVQLVLSTSKGESPLDDVSLPEIAGGACTTIDLAGLDLPATADLLKTLAGHPVRADFAATCRQVTGGNPHLLHKLLGVLHDRLGATAWDATSEELRALTDQSIGELLRIRLRPVPGAAEVVCAVAVLDADASLDKVAALAGLDLRSTLNAVDTLVRLRVLSDTHPPALPNSFLRNAVLADMPVATRAAGHAQAARLLSDAGAADGQVATHLLEADSMTHPWGTEVLRRAARDATHHGEPELARVFLKRALREQLPPEQRLAVQLELAHVEYVLDPGSAKAHLRETLVNAVDPHAAANLSLAMLVRSCGGLESRLAISSAVQVVGRLTSAERDLDWQLRCASYLAAIGNDLGMVAYAKRYADELQAEMPEDHDLRRTRAVLLAIGFARRGDSSAEALRYAKEALAGNRVDVCAQPFVFTIFTSMLADDPDLTDQFCRMIETDAEPADYHLRKGTSAAVAHGVLFHMAGSLLRARAILQAPMRLFEELDAVTTCPTAMLCSARLIEVLIDLGRYGEAADLLARSRFTDEMPELFQHNYVLYARGRLRLATGDADGALTDLLECGHRLDAWGVTNPALVPWRAHAVKALLLLEKPEEAAELAKENLDAAERWDTPRVIGAALVAIGRLGDSGALTKAIELLTSSPAELDLAEALLELGSLFRKLEQHDKAVPHLRRAVDLSTKCGAKPLQDLACDELHACETALTTSRDTLRGLTKQETRIAGMAARGLTNRQIAEATHLTRRTVELHLSGAYRKLAISGRGDLAAALWGP
jgi:DNA-binding CsgD family transcriptional regulator/tetratricopeptide (TPR) repeat protein